jgi:hypothetical protein
VAATSRAVTWFNRRAAEPSKWMRLLNPVILVFIVVGAWHRRGWWFGLIAAIIYGAMFLPTAIKPGAVVDWSRRHPRLDGAAAGPLLFGGLGLITHISIWWCVLAGVLGTVSGAALGQRKANRRGKGLHSPV